MANHVSRTGWGVSTLALLAFLLLIAGGALAFYTPALPAAGPNTPAPATADDQAVPAVAEPAAPTVEYWPAEVRAEDGPWTGRLARIEEHLAILTVRGSSAERGAAHGHLLKSYVAALVKGVRTYLRPEPARDAERYAQCLDGARKMAEFLEADIRTEVKACAEAAEVDADELMLAQLFGDVARAKGFATFCSSFAAFGSATKDGELVVGRNFDYAGHGLEDGLPLILQAIPTGAGAGRPFVTIGYAGILNGWTAMNDAGLCASNNTLFGGQDSIEGVATCFLLRQIVERASTVEEGVKLVQVAKRACTTGMLVAGKNGKGEWDARFVEFDHAEAVVVKPKDGRVLSTNTRQRLAAVGDQPPSGPPSCGRWQKLKQELERLDGALDFADPKTNPVALHGVYLSINLHCALLDPAPGAQRIRLAVERGDHVPAAQQPFRAFRVEPERVVEIDLGE
ncbi:MAG: C45 family peptidase [Planctomycetota bacterium]|nr:C45 family peptidase [Planctomycetota bacterium]